MTARLKVQTVPPAPEPVPPQPLTPAQRRRTQRAIDRYFADFGHEVDLAIRRLKRRERASRGS